MGAKIDILYSCVSVSGYITRSLLCFQRVGSKQVAANRWPRPARIGKPAQSESTTQPHQRTDGWRLLRSRQDEYFVSMQTVGDLYNAH